MKKICFLLILFCLLPSCATAQWYLFPGKKNPAGATVPDSVSRTKPDSTAVLRTAADSLAAAADSLGVPAIIPAWEDVFVSELPDVVHIALVLPLQASDKPSDNFLDFYSGALLALRDLGKNGLRADLQVFDSADTKASLEPAFGAEQDLLIGPVALADIRGALTLLDPRKVLVSPLDPAAAPLAETGPVVQSPSPWSAQLDDLVRWVAQDKLVNEEIYVVRDTAAAGQGEQTDYLMRRLLDSGIRYHSVLSVNEIPFARNRQFRVMIASDRDSFFASAVRSLSIEGARNDDIILYGTSRIRANGTGPADLHNTNAHLVTPYFIDYEDPAVADFILAYRALFQNEPGSFSFQGYDTMRYFVTMCTKFGRQWYKRLPEYSQKGLQADFRFSLGSPRVNQAVRRVVYNKDLTTVQAR